MKTLILIARTIFIAAVGLAIAIGISYAVITTLYYYEILSTGFGIISFFNGLFILTPIIAIITELIQLKNSQRWLLYVISSVVLVGLTWGDQLFNWELGANFYAIYTTLILALNYLVSHILWRGLIRLVKTVRKSVRLSSPDPGREC